MTGKEIAEKLREAVRLMNETGRHWVKDEWEIEVGDGEYGYCSLAAIRTVTSTPVEDESEASEEVAWALAEVLPPSEQGAADPTSGMYWQITTWNDAPERTWEDVVAKFEEAAAKVEVA